MFLMTPRPRKWAQEKRCGQVEVAGAAKAPNSQDAAAANAIEVRCGQIIVKLTPANNFTP